MLISESGDEYDEKEPEPQPERDSDEEIDQDEEYDWENDFNPNEDYDWKNEFDPNEDYDWENDSNPEEDSNPENEPETNEMSGLDEENTPDDRFLDKSEGGNDFSDEIPEVNPEDDGSNEIPDETPDDINNETNDLFDENVPDADPDKELDDSFKEYEPETNPDKELDGEINKPSNSGTVTVLEPEQTEQGYEHEQEQEEKPDNTKPVDSEGEPLKPIQNEDEEIKKIIFDAEEMAWKKMEFLGEHVSSHDEMEVEMLEEEMEELFNKYVEIGLEQLETSYDLIQENHQEYQELEERPEEAYTEEQELETSHDLNQENHQEHQELEERPEEAYTQEQGLETPYELNQENHQDHQELEERPEEAYTEEQELETSHELILENHQEKQEFEERLEEVCNQEQEEKVKLEIERAQEQNEKEDIKESLHTKIKENMQELSQEIKQSNRKSQEIEQEITQKGLQNIVQEEIQEQVEKQKELTLKKSAKLFKERYREETGRRPIYAEKETKGFMEWKDHLKEQGEEQEENDKLFREKKKEIKEHSKEIRESKEEWAQYLENSIKEAEFSEEIKTELNEILEKYEKLRELLKNLKNKEISKEIFEKEVKEFEYLLIEKRYITRPLFMNFDWFRRYYNGRIKKSGKMVAHLYISKKTREFLSYISGRIKQLNNIGNSQKNVEEFKEFFERSFQIKERWALLLNRIILKAPNKEISTEVKEELEAVIKIYCEIRAILFNKNILEVDKEKLIQGRIEKINSRFFELFEILKRFLGAYADYSRKWMEQSLILEGKKTIRQLSQKLKAIKEEFVQEMLNGDNSMLYKFKEILRVNLYKSTELNINEKSKLIKIIQKKDISEEDGKVIKSLLGNLSKGELITLLKYDFLNYFQNLLPKPDLSYEKRQDVKKVMQTIIRKMGNTQDLTKLENLILGVDPFFRGKTAPQGHIFDPDAPNLKYPTNDNDNPSTKALKTLLNIIYKFEPQIYDYHVERLDNQEYGFTLDNEQFKRNEKGDISLPNLGKILGVFATTVNNYIGRLQDTEQNQAAYTIRENLYLKLKVGIEKTFNNRQLQEIYLIAENALKIFALNEWGEVPFTVDLRSIFSAYSSPIDSQQDKVFSEIALSKTLGRSDNYVHMLKNQGIKDYETTEKYFKVLTLINLIDDRKVRPYNGDDSIKKIKEKSINYLFERMKDSDIGIIVSDDMRDLFDLTIEVLTTLTIVSKPRNTINDKQEIFSITDLSRITSKSSSRQLFREKFRYGYSLAGIQGHRIKKLLRSCFVQASIDHKRLISNSIFAIDSHLRRHESEYHKYFRSDLYEIQVYELFKITLGLDLWGLDFSEDAEYSQKSGKYNIDVRRHHPWEEKSVYTIFDKVSFLVNLIPLTGSSHTIIGNYIQTGQSIQNQKIVARFMHLYELIQKPYQKGKDYYNELNNEFKIEIWENFDKNKIDEWIERWHYMKENPNTSVSQEDKFFSEYYKKWYYRRFWPKIVDYHRFLQKDPYTERPDFWHWFLNYYLRENKYPV